LPGLCSPFHISFPAASLPIKREGGAATVS
jgi:hypothetical protein